MELGGGWVREKRQARKWEFFHAAFLGQTIIAVSLPVSITLCSGLGGEAGGKGQNKRTLPSSPRPRCPGDDSTGPGPLLGPWRALQAPRASGPAIWRGHQPFPLTQDIRHIEPRLKNIVLSKNYICQIGIDVASNNAFCSLMARMLHTVLWGSCLKPFVPQPSP